MTEEIPKTHTNGSTKTTSPIKPVPPTKPTATITELDAQIPLNAKTACPTKVAGRKPEPKSMESQNMEYPMERLL